ATYKVTWKSEGLRCLLLITNPGVVYLLDERNEAYRVSGLTFPYSGNTSKQIFTTLLDGELVFDQDAGKSRPRYLIHDILHFRCSAVRKMDFNVRELCIQKEIIEARRQSAQAGVFSPVDEPFSIRKKDFFPVNMTGELLAPTFRSQVPHRVDGVVFKPVYRSYASGCEDGMLDWTFPRSNVGDASMSEKSLLEAVRLAAARGSARPSPASEDERPSKRSRNI
ncbi:mRNA-capping enzyme-like, partial [Galendromus occidentalis]|uniref:mRNA-capping enzyme-like n=1 Tax=Galendromus occidentalis TaxID=34638 RepID=A0AAJ7L508_9ACAR